ncbi:MAG: CocE/NonD family hydrolase [bacterium]
MLKTKIKFTIILSGLLFTLSAAAQEKLPTEEEFFQIIRTQGIDRAVDVFHKARQSHPDASIFRELALNDLGYEFLRAGKVAEAIEIFKLNVVAFPDAFNTYDSLGEAYMLHGDRDLAIKNYKKSVELNPDNITADRFAYVLEHYTKQEYQIPMRDRVKLFTQVYLPRDKSQKYPILLFRTPYSIRRYGPNNYRSILGPSEFYAKEGFIFVYQDVRGKFRSEGEFIVMKPHKTHKQSSRDTDESSDTYDTIAWLLKNIPNHNGRVGQWGISYPGWQTVMGMIEAHPALKASSPQASPSDMWIGDDFHHNGAFRLMYTFGWLSNNARVRSGPSATRSARFDYGTPDGYNFFLELGPVSNVDKKYFHNQVPTWNEYMQHSDYDDYWRKQNVLQYLNNIKPAVLNVAGWFDAEDFYGPMSIYYTIEKKNSNNKSTLVVGPWLHGGWARMDGDYLGNIQFDVKTSVYFRKKVELPFFNYYLKDRGELNLPEALVFETGSNQWKSYDHWPPKQAKEKKLYFHGHGNISFTPPFEASELAFDSYTSDPDKPVPWSSEIRTSQGHLWMIEDQRFASRRPDVLVYQSDVLTEDITIAGPIIANLFVATTGTDADWIVKLIDVYPGNAPDNKPNPTNVRMGDFQMLLAGEVFRSKYRHSYENPEPLLPNKVTKIEYDLRDKSHTFLKGHRIMVQVQSTWFPVIDRNPQKFVDIYHAKEEDFQKAVQKVYRSRQFPSHLRIYVVESDGIE